MGFNDGTSNGETHSHFVEGGNSNKKRVPAFTVSAHAPSGVQSRVFSSFFPAVLFISFCQGVVLRNHCTLKITIRRSATSCVCLALTLILLLSHLFSRCASTSPGPPLRKSTGAVPDVISSLFGMGAAKTSGAGRVQSAANVEVHF